MSNQTFETPPGGVMTVEVGAITGPVTVTLVPSGGSLSDVFIAYEGSDDRYTVEGSPTVADISAVIAQLSSDPGVDGDGNPKFSTLAG